MGNAAKAATQRATCEDYKGEKIHVGQVFHDHLGNPAKVKAISEDGKRVTMDTGDGAEFTVTPDQIRSVSPDAPREDCAYVGAQDPNLLALLEGMED